MLEYFNQWQRQIASLDDLELVLQKLLETVHSLSHFSRAIIYLSQPTTWVARGIDATQSKYASLVETCVRTGRSKIYHASDSHTMPETWLKSVLILPLEKSNGTAGAIYLDWIEDHLTTDTQTHLEQLVQLCAVVIENKILTQHFQRLYTKRLKQSHQFPNIIGNSNEMISLLNTIPQIAASDAAVLITGESGTGKDLIALAIHDLSPRSDEPFIPIDCGAIPPELLESELFGHKKGAFTGANSDKVGLLEQAGYGTVFLDEITNTSMALQAKLLRVLQEKQVRPVGDNISRPIHARFISATNKELEDEIDAERFRADLFFRLNVLQVELPALRSRREDIPHLIHFFMEKISQTYGLMPKVIAPNAMAKLVAYHWPGNVRELENLIERLMVLVVDDAITLNDIPENIADITQEPIIGYSLYDHEKALIQKVLTKTKWNIKQAARFLDISRTTLYSKIEKHGLNLADHRFRRDDEPPN